MNRRTEGPGRYEQEGMPPKSLIWIYCLVKGAWRDECRCECLCVCVSALYVCSCLKWDMYISRVGGWTVETYRGDEGTTSVVAVKLTCKPTFVRQ